MMENYTDKIGMFKKGPKRPTTPKRNLRGQLKIGTRKKAKNYTYI